MKIYICDICRKSIDKGDLLVQKIGKDEQYHIECFSEKYCDVKEYTDTNIDEDSILDISDLK